MRFRTWPVVAVALVGLLLVVVVSVVAIRTKAQIIYSQLDQLNDRHRQVESRLRRMRGDVHASGIFVRDYLLDTSRENTPELSRPPHPASPGQHEHAVGAGGARRAGRRCPCP